jgi:kynurenine 3-monooxygenase
MNCAFEDCLLLDRALEASADDWGSVLPSFAASRKRATDALAQLAIDNYEEMRDKTVSRAFLLKVKCHEALHAVLGAAWQPSLHSAVTFTSLPYDEARATCEWQDAMLVRAGCAIGALAVSAAAAVAVRAVRA